MEDRSTKMKRRLLMAMVCQWEGDGKGSPILTSSVPSKANREIGQKDYNVQESQVLRQPCNRSGLYEKPTNTKRRYSRLPRPVFRMYY
jgi:hypothetical protein